MLFPPLTHISANMATFSYQENLLHYGSEKQQASPPIMVTGLCPAIFFSVVSILLCCLCPPSRGVLEPAQSARGRHRHCFPILCSMMSDCGLKPSRLRIFTQKKSGNTTIWAFDFFLFSFFLLFESQWTSTTSSSLLNRMLYESSVVCVFWLLLFSQCLEQCLAKTGTQ